MSAMNEAAFTTDDAFLKFEYDGTEFLVPIDDVIHITNLLPEDACVLGTEKADLRSCYIEVRGEQGSVFLTAHQVFTVVTVEAHRQKYLPNSVKTSDNSWIFAMAFEEETKKAMFFIDSHKLKGSEAPL